MNVQKLGMATLVGTVVNFLTGWLLFGILLKSTYAGGYTAEAMAVTKSSEQENLMFYALGSLAFALLLAYIYERWAGIRTFVTGATAGAIIWMLVAIQIDSNFLASTNWFANNYLVLLDIIGYGIIGAITGGVVGWMLGYNRS